MYLRIYKVAQILNHKTFSLVAPCNNLKCENNTDTCVRGACQCGDSPGLVCNADTNFPYCLEGKCACTKTAGSFERGDGTTQGSCKLASDKCHLDGTCAECQFPSHCYGLTDTCENGKCGCGSGPPCNQVKSSSCTNGVCKCGDNPTCQDVDSFDASQADPRDNNVYPGLQRRANEVCELITEYYNPKFIENHPLMVNGTVNGSPTYAVDYDDTKGQHTGTYQCLGKKKWNK